MHDLTRIRDPQGLLTIDWRRYTDVPLNDETIFQLLKIAGALWIHEHSNKSDAELRLLSDPKPHAGLSAGGCSAGFLDTVKALAFTPLQMLLAQEHVRRIRQVYPGKIDWVIGSDHAAATYSAFVALQLGARHDFTEKVTMLVDGKPVEKQVWKRHGIDPDEIVLQCEELSTTGATPERVAAGVQEAHLYPITWAPIYAFAVNRTGTDTYHNKQIVSVVTLSLPTWKSPEECPLCAAGSKRIKVPKKQWKELTV